VNTDGSVMREEIFGPVLPFLSFHDFEEAVSIIQKIQTLYLFIFLLLLRKRRSLRSRLSFGGGCVNNTAWHFTNHHMPFGGVGNRDREYSWKIYF
jgi:aldehyde dehydrogenase (NAD+)